MNELPDGTLFLSEDRDGVFRVIELPSNERPYWENNYSAYRPVRFGNFDPEMVKAVERLIEDVAGVPLYTIQLELNGGRVIAEGEWIDTKSFLATLLKLCKEKFCLLLVRQALDTNPDSPFFGKAFLDIKIGGLNINGEFKTNLRKI